MAQLELQEALRLPSVSSDPYQAVAEAVPLQRAPRGVSCLKNHLKTEELSIGKAMISRDVGGLSTLRSRFRGV
jgi:hypothetical protein